MSQIIEIKVPDIGDYKDVPVIEVLVKAGDKVEKEQSIVVLESDKATMDVPSSHAGVVKDVKVKVGDTLSEGSVVITLEEALEIYSKPKERRRGVAKPPLKDFGVDPVTGKHILVKDGRFGMFITDGETNATLRRGDTLEALDLDRAQELLAGRRAWEAENN
mgnify:CR=1 FL=1